MVERFTFVSTWDDVQICVLWCVYMEFFKKSHWEPWIWHVFTSHWLAYLKSSFANVENAMRIYLTLMVTNCSWERSFSKF